MNRSIASSTIVFNEAYYDNPNRTSIGAGVYFDGAATHSIALSTPSTTSGPVMITWLSLSRHSTSSSPPWPGPPVSRPGRRVYAPAKEIPEVLGGLGISIVSTSRGILTGKQAREAKLGGEILCNIW